MPFDAAQRNTWLGEAFLRFGKGRKKVGLNHGDCASYALAKSKHASLLVKGEDFRRTDATAALAAAP